MRRIAFKYGFSSILAIVLLLAGVPWASANTLHVDILEEGVHQDSHCTLREAIQRVNGKLNDTYGCEAASSDGTDVIVFENSGSPLYGTIYLTQGRLDITKAVAIQAIPGTITIDGKNNSPILNITAQGGQVKLSGLKLTHGKNA